MTASDPAPPRPPVPAHLTFASLSEAVQECHACELWEGATQAVMGEGPARSRARLMLVGEQPGDREDVEGKPFVGPARGQALLGSRVRVGRDRGRPIDSDLAPLVTLTIHPSAILRQRDEAERAAAMDAFVADLTVAARWLAER